MGIDTTGGNNMPLARNRFSAGAYQNIYPRLGIGITGFANRSNAPVFDTDIRFDNPPIIQNQGIGNHHINHFGRRALALTHAITDDFAAAKLHLIAVNGVILFHLNE